MQIREDGYGLNKCRDGYGLNKCREIMGLKEMNNDSNRVHRYIYECSIISQSHHCYPNMMRNILCEYKDMGRK